LPGKVLRRLGHATVLGHVVRRVAAAGVADRIVIATSTAAADAAVVDEAGRLGVAVTRGPEDDVLRRFVMAFDEHGGETGIRVTSDCPVLDPAVVAAVVGLLSASPGVSYASNTVERSYPRGLDVEAFSVEALRAADRESRDPAEREHVTPFLYRRPERFGIRQLTRDDPDRSADWRLTLDTEADWSLLEAVFAALGPAGEMFGLPELEALLRSKPELLELNRHIAQKTI